MKKVRVLKVSCLILMVTAFVGCDDVFTPRPRGFFRIDLPEKTYRSFESNCPFSFEYPEYAVVINHESPSSMPCWLNVEFPEFQGTLHLSYFEINNNSDESSGDLPIEKYLEDARKLAMKHTIKAHSINEDIIANPGDHVYGTLYNIEGINTASSVQFYLTDSVNHFLRGALYFNVAPKNDSLAPVITFIKEDVLRFIESFKWKSDIALLD